MQGASPQYRILVVDDEPEVLDLMTEILSRCGWTVEPYTSPLKALQRARRSRFDALVLDLYMPELPGMLVHAKVKLADRELARRTIFVTGHFSRDELRRDLESAALVLMKPFEPIELVRCVEAVLPNAPRAVA